MAFLDVPVIGEKVRLFRVVFLNFVNVWLLGMLRGLSYFVSCCCDVFDLIDSL